MKMKRACQKHSNHFDWKLPFCSSNSEIIIYVLAYRIICSSYFLLFSYYFFSVPNQPMYIFRANKRTHSNINVFNMILHCVLNSRTDIYFNYFRFIYHIPYVHRSCLQYIRKAHKFQNIPKAKHMNLWTIT